MRRRTGSLADISEMFTKTGLSSARRTITRGKQAPVGGDVDDVVGILFADELEQAKELGVGKRLEEALGSRISP